MHLQKLISLATFFFGAVLLSPCQIVLSGKIMGGEERQALPFANIGILNTEVGTISNEDGTFRIRIPEEYSDRNLLFSSIGFERKSVSISKISELSSLDIQLESKTTELKTVEIFAIRSKPKRVELGNGASLMLSGQLHFDTLSAGSAMALLIDRSEHEDFIFLEKAALYIAKNRSPQFKVRLRILDVDTVSGKPGIDLLNIPMVQSSDKKRGWLDFNMREIQAIEDNQFFLVFEWIMNKHDREYVASKYAEYMETYPERVSHDTTTVNGEVVVTPRINKVVAGTIFGVTLSRKSRTEFPCFYRSNSFGEWKPSSGILSAKVTLSNTPVLAPVAKKVPPCEDLTCVVNLWAESFTKRYDLQGLQLTIGTKDSTVFSSGYGYADVNLGIGVNDQTRFRIASVSKTMTAAAIVQLHATGQLHLDSTIQKYVPEFPDQKYPITVRQLAGHLGGIRDFYEKSWDEIFVQQQYSNLSDALSIFKEDSLEAMPGTSFNYSSYGYILLGAAIESVTGQPYLEYMRQNIWEPLGMNATYGDVFDSLMVDKSRFYFVNGEEATPYDLSYSYPSGGLISNTDDLVEFGLALANDGLLDETTKESMFQIQLTSTGEPTGYGLGWYVENDDRGNPRWFHPGELPSTGALLLISPNNNIALALLTNSPIVSDDNDGYLKEVHALLSLLERYH